MTLTRLSRCLSIFCLLLAAMALGCAGPQEATNTFSSVRGQRIQIPAPQAKATVLVFISSTCPIANGYAPEINRLTGDYKSRGIAFFLVHTEKDLTQEQAEAHLKKFSYESDVLLDPERRLVKRTGATITPEAAVLSPEGKLWYRGRIDDRYPLIGIQREKPTKTELRDALEAILASKLVPVPRTKATGCFIE